MQRTANPSRSVRLRYRPPLTLNIENRMNLILIGFDKLEEGLLTSLLKGMFKTISTTKSKTNDKDSFIITINEKDIPQNSKRYLVVSDEKEGPHFIKLPILPSELKQKIKDLLVSEDSFTCDKFKIKDNTFFCNKQEIELTQKEQELLLFLLKQPNHYATPDEILKNIWGYDKNIQTNTLKTHIYNLRQKLELTTQANLIQTDDNGYSLKF